MLHLHTWPAKGLPRVPTSLYLTSDRPCGLDRLLDVCSLIWPG
jgi:predicted RNA polymerase sigma factor